MIYLPHPTFDFEGANGGSVSGFVPDPSGDGLRWADEVDRWQADNKNLIYLPIWKIDVNKIISKFDKARSSYWEGRHYKSPDTTYCFLREDGHEFAIRLIKSNVLDRLLQKWDIITYSRGLHILHNIVEFKIWLERVAPIF